MKHARLVNVTRKTPMDLYHALLDHYGAQNWWPAETPFEVIVGAVLTQRTSWKNVELAIENLKRAGLMSPEILASSDLKWIRELVKPSGFYKVKAQRILNLAKYIKKCGGLSKLFKKDLEDLRMELLELEGIGKETADSILLYAGDKPIFVIDAYSMRLCERLAFPVKRLSYDEIQRFFQTELPTDVELYKELHALIVIHCKERCKTKPICKECPILKICEFQKREPSAKD